MSSDLDFEAWEAPPPPDGLADVVIARLGGTAVGLAMPDAEAPRRRRWVIAASAAAVLVVVGGMWAIVRGRERAPAQNGAVIADRAEHVELPGATVELDRGADVHWHRTSDGLDIEQRAGTAVWHVGKDEKIVIGAAVASIEAAGASLRVEVPMSLPISRSDARMLGTSALTAATVAMVTVVVYEGHVKVSQSGQTVVVQPGTTYKVPGPTLAPEPPVVGVAPVTAPSGHPKLAILGLERSSDGVAGELVNDLRARAKAAGGPFVLAAGSDKELADEVLLHDCENQASDCMAKIGVELGADDLMYGSIASERAGYRVTLKLLDVGRKVIVRTTTQLIPTAQSQGAELAGWAKQIYSFLTGANAVDEATTCDVDALVAQGNDAMAQDQQAVALVKYEAAIACKPEKRLYQLAFMASCNAKDVTKAAEYWSELSSDDQNRMVQMCVRNGIMREQLDPSTCDVTDLTQKGMAQEQIGQHAAALATFEQAIRCQPSTRLYQLAFMTSCNAKSVSKSQYYYLRLPTSTRDQLRQICVRNGISPETLEGLAPNTPDVASGQGRVRVDSVPQAKVLFDGVDAGTTPVLVKAVAGKHKVTLVVGQDRFTYPVTVKAGETETLSKDLQ